MDALENFAQTTLINFFQVLIYGKSNDWDILYPFFVLALDSSTANSL